ncbi:phage/plasmid primase, P4 family [Streptomyces sp. NBC_01728]|uniref:DNA primase family protein n=1 Tax=unclassified Streptomyces TaxID=2593676 RepID=UPI002254F486|nr:MULTISPECIES: phage/plasmid primase, P4 family [unclassified Streptomyces]MCX4460713.1 phage/plasmid primase, P4 family [Streptomyces sp. NBC_01719]MCX4499957.1 phage/plasmid primase, P4 family [Streptomyces sp. NBC_01728]
MSSAEPIRFDAALAAEQIQQQQSLDIPLSGEPALLPAQARAEGVRRAPAAGLLPEELTDRGNAKLFARLYSDRFRHVEGLGWYCWDQYRWKRTGGEKGAMWAAGDMAEQMPHTDPHGVFGDREVSSHRRRTQSTAGMKALLQQAQAAPGLSLDPDVLDGDMYALCTPGGVVDLRTGDLHKPDPLSDMHSRATSVGPEDMPIPRWRSFLRDTFGDDDKGRETIDFLHLLLGYSVTGDVGAQVLPFLYGSGANGKSVLLEVMMQILGEYANAAPPGFLMEKGKFTEHSTELTELHGRRIVVCSELKPNDKFNEARVKLLTGGDTITARRMRQDFFTFTPTHKLWLLGNHRPEVGTGGYAFWRRMRIIPFERKVPDALKIDNLAQELVCDEGPGILYWLIEGARRYLATRDSLHGPASVRLATEAYEKTEDHIGRFITERCTKGSDGQPNPDLRVEQKLLYETYVRWCSDEGIRPATSRAFASRIRQELGLSSPAEMIKNNDRKLYPGLALLSDAGAEPGE